MQVGYIIEDLLPDRQVHLLGGPSGSGKTTFAFQMLDALGQGQEFLGRKTTKVSYGYVSGDRPARSVEETLQRVGMNFPVYSLVDRDQIGTDLANIVLPSLPGFYGYKPDFVYIDGFTAMVPGGQFNDYSIVAKWLGSLQRYCVSKGVTIMGACHATKTKQGEAYLNPRQRIAGSVAWAGFAETVIIIDPIEEEGRTHLRKVLLLPRNKPDESIEMYFDEEGLLRVSEAQEHREAAAAFLLPSIIPQRFIPGQKVDYRGMMKTALEKGISRRTFDRAMSRLVEEGKLIREKKGTYTAPGMGTSGGETGPKQTQSLQTPKAQTEQ